MVRGGKDSDMYVCMCCVGSPRYHNCVQGEFAELVLAGHPFVIRGGADRLGIKRFLWTRRNFEAQYGDRRAIVNTIPCVVLLVIAAARLTVLWRPLWCHLHVAARAAVQASECEYTSDLDFSHIPHHPPCLATCSDVFMHVRIRTYRCGWGLAATRTPSRPS